MDCCFKDNECNYHIIDFKTSSLYKGDKALKESGQLVLYAIALNQMGVPFEKIRIAWNFLKYVTIEYEQANGDKKERQSDRCEIGKSLQSNAKMWLKKFGYDPNDYLPQVLDTMDVKCLPQEVQEKITISDCYVEVPLTGEQIEYWRNYVIDTIKEIESAVLDYEVFDNEEVFYDTVNEVKNESFYYATLSEYSVNMNPCYKKYLEKVENGIDFLT
jgi:hypothetical protein